MLNNRFLHNAYYLLSILVFFVLNYFFHIFIIKMFLDTFFSETGFLFIYFLLYPILFISFVFLYIYILTLIFKIKIFNYLIIITMIIFSQIINIVTSGNGILKDFLYLAIFPFYIEMSLFFIIWGFVIKKKKK